MEEKVFYIAESNKSFEQVMNDLTKAIKKEGFSVLHVIDMQKKFQSIGQESKGVSIVEICNPETSYHAISVDKRMICMMPKAINVYEDDDGKVKLIFMRANADKLEQLFPGHDIKSLSKKVAKTLETIINNSI